MDRITVREAILEVLREKPYWWWFKSEIARVVQKRFWGVARNQETIFRELRRLVEEGLVEREGSGRKTQYRLKEGA